jgi:hypothetical protein
MTLDVLYRMRELLMDLSPTTGSHDSRYTELMRIIDAAIMNLVNFNEAG